MTNNMNRIKSNRSILSAFYKHLLEFVTDLITIFPEDATLKTFKTYLEGLRKINPKSVLVGWKYYVTDKYKADIYNGNIDFFLNKDYQEDLGDIPEDTTYYLDIIEKIRKPLLQLSLENKKKATKYLSNLTKLSELY